MFLKGLRLPCFPKLDIYKVQREERVREWENEVQSTVRIIEIPNEFRDAETIEIPLIYKGFLRNGRSGEGGATIYIYIYILAWTCQLNWQIECGIDRYVGRVVYPDWYVESIVVWAKSFILIGVWNRPLRGQGRLSWLVGGIDRFVGRPANPDWYGGSIVTWLCTRIGGVALDVA